MRLYAGIGFAFLLLMAGYQNGGISGGSTSLASRPPPDVRKVFANEANRINKEKGKKQGMTTFIEAHAQGMKLHYQYEIAADPRRVDAADAERRFMSQAKSLLCSGPMLRALNEGGVIEYNYRSQKTKELILEIRLTRSSCSA